MPCVTDRTCSMLLERVLRRLGPRSAQLPPPSDEERLASYPPPYPMGWYVLCHSDELKAGGLKYIQALGRKLVVFRGEDGTPGVLDAYCPHLGANLAGGKVRDGCVECPFHRWKFAVDGSVAHVPYSDRISRKMAARAYPTRDHHGMLVSWFAPAPAVTPLRAHAAASHASGGLADQPRWSLDPLADIADGSLVYRGEHDAGVVRMHLCEFAENSADMRHFQPLHGDMFVPWTNVKLPFLGIEHNASWEADAERPHIAYFRDEAELTAFGKAIPNSGAHAVITFYGAGSLVSFRFERPDVGTIVMFQSHLPEAPLRQRVRFRWFAQPHIPRALVLYVVGTWVSQWREDISIWENKIYQAKPMLVPGDGPMHAMRRWFQQFYPAANGAGQA